METRIYEMSETGKMQPVNASAFANLEPGAVLLWGGNMAWGPTRFCILSRTEGSHGVSYQCFNMDELNKNSHLHFVESWSIKDPNDKSVWHSQHMFIQPETIDSETVAQYRIMHEAQRTAQEDIERKDKAEADRLEALGRKLWPSLIGNCPAVIVAELEKDVSDSQSDYFGSETVNTVILAPSSHKRDLFPEMRKAADILPETQHLGTGKGRFTPYVEISQDFLDHGMCRYQGQRSPWHNELQHDERGLEVVFTTKAEAQAYIESKGEPEPINFDGVTATFSWKIREDEIEHREKYSMGKGYYLAVSTYHGWQVSKEVFYKGEPQREHFITLAKRYDHLVKKTEPKPAQVETPESAPAGDCDYTVTYEREWTWIKFPCKPEAKILDALRGRAHWGSKRGAWYVTRHVDESEIARWFGKAPAAPKPQDPEGDLIPPMPEPPAPELEVLQPAPVVRPSRFALMGDD